MAPTGYRSIYRTVAENDVCKIFRTVTQCRVLKNHCVVHWNNGHAKAQDNRYRIRYYI